MGLKIKLQKKDDGTVVLFLEGSVDTDTYQEFEKKLAEASDKATRGVLLDMGKLEYISSIGFGVLVRAKQDIEKKNITMVVANLSPNVKRIFDAVKMIPDSLFATLEKADEYLDQYIEYVSRREEGCQ